MAKRLLTDACAAIRLLGLGDRLFKKGILPAGDLVFHQKIFQETRKWKPATKTKYAREFQLLHGSGFRPDPALRVEPNDLATQIKVISATESEIGASLSLADKEQLASAIYHEEVSLV